MLFFKDTEHMVLCSLVCVCHRISVILWCVLV